MSDADLPAPELTTAADGNTTIVRVTGEIDLSNSDELRDRCLEFLDAGVDALVIDLSEVTFFASSGIAALGQIRVHNATRQRPVHVVASRTVRRSLEVTAMDSLLPLHESLENALVAAKADVT
ncbi:STAS domain-containing protein [Saccharothrix hoggarensis]|uniref:Anti-sigma factor antagonist n=1 Tax=Saccharothrix hoggarensis TaxID=913853 RepID=A0ABW3QWB4_9PSEU